MQLSQLIQNEQLLVSLLMIFFIFRSARNMLYVLFVWQRRDYRLDRMWVHLLTESGQRWAFGNLALLKWIVLFVYAVVPNIRSILLPVLFIFLFESLLILREWLQRGIKKPALTPKIAVIVLITCLLLGALIFLHTSVPLTLLLADKALPIVIFFLILILKIPFISYKWLLISRARKKIAQYPKLTRIGITGSYGKSSTKEFLSALLSEKYTVVATPENINTDIGIAKLILTKVNQNTEVIVLEMGAYKKGEIRNICSFVSPQIGIVTGINEQHIELFGSLANTRAAKYELIEALPKTGLAVFNDDNEYTRLMAKKTHLVKVITYGTKKDAHVGIRNIKETQQGIQLEVQTKTEKLVIQTKLLGKHQIYNLTSAILVARYLQVPKTLIEKKVKEFMPPAHSLQVAGKYKGATLIDDTANANPDGVKAALEVLSLFPGKKYVVLTPLIELGTQTLRIHQELIREAEKSVTLLLLTNKSYFEELSKIATKLGRKDLLQMEGPKKGAELLRRVLTSGDVVVFLGKEARQTLKELQTKKI